MPEGMDGHTGFGHAGPVCGCAAGALAAVAMDLEALAIAVGDLEGEGCMKPQSQAVDSGEVDLIV
jgi:hypothetical protein